MAECSWAKEGNDTCDMVAGANRRIEYLQAKLEQCREYLSLLQQAFEVDGKLIDSMHAFRLITRRVEIGHVESLLEDVDSAVVPIKY